MTSELSFYYGSMGCGKSTYVLQLRYTLSKAGFNPLLVKPTTDVRDFGVVRSRMGVEHPCSLLRPNQDVLDILPRERITHIIADEAQFMSDKNVMDMVRMVDMYDLPVYLFGLRTDYTGRLFQATSTIMALADNLIELPLIYKDGGKAIMHIRNVDGVPVFDGESIFVGDIDEEYESVSRREFFIRKDLQDGPK